ncbi:regulatory protein RecX [Arhodomonas sp. SL1]|uniref:regulatory protein RecX n=1 Tax=Arhodomonas sp. SL1 TaxID=3425691 RepID=UPI003F882603
MTAADDPRGDAEAVAVRLLARREHSERELARKLAQRGHDEQVIGEVIADLAERGLVSDARFAGEYVRSRSAQGYGPVRIRAELARRGVDETLIEPHLPDEAVWLEQLRSVHHKRFGADPPETPRERARRTRYLLNRGFPSEQVRRVLDAPEGGEADE